MVKVKSIPQTDAELPNNPGNQEQKIEDKKQCETCFVFDRFYIKKNNKYEPLEYGVCNLWNNDLSIFNSCNSYLMCCRERM